MTQKEFMKHSLEELVHKNEKLQSSIFGILKQSHSDFFGFFGLTDKALVIALISGKKVTYTNRLLLSDMKTIRINKNSPNQYEIAISFGEGELLRIIANKKVLRIDTQEQELPFFIETLSKAVPEENTLPLKKTEGTKIRVQYFNVCLYPLFGMLIPILAILYVIFLTLGRFDTLYDFFVAPILILVLDSPIIALSLLNRFFFGKTVGVLTCDGIYTEYGFFPWDKIKKITYLPQVPSKHARSTEDFCHAVITVNERGNITYETIIPHCPLYAIRKMKKLSSNPNIEFKYDFSDITTTVIISLAMILIIAILFFIFT